MLLVVIGAGASFDCVNPSVLPDGGDNLPAKHRPPLAADLFSGQWADSVLATVPVAETAVADMQEALETEGATVEGVLQQWRDEAPTNEYRRKRLNATRFFLQRRLEEASQWKAVGMASGRTNYVHLVRRIELWRERADERVIYVTFNYDTLLDRALVNSSLVGWDRPQDYVQSETTRLIKAHGSVDWWHKVDTELHRKMTLSDWAAVVVRDATESNTDPEPVIRRRSQQLEGMTGPPHLPAIAIPATRKTEREFECPQQHLGILKSSLPEVTRLLVIGWSGQEEHFLDLLAGSFMRLRSAAAVSNTEQGASTVLSHLWRNLKRGQADFEFSEPKFWTYAGFTDFIASYPWEFLNYEPDDGQP